MKTVLTFTLLVFLASSVPAQEKMQTVNAVLQDNSYVATFGILPDAAADEKVRVQTHLRYVEKLLRNNSPEALTHEQRVNRAYVLDILHQYTEAGLFPSNRDYPGERRPCFIDKVTGNICAVGYLIEQTIGREIAEWINNRYQYALLLEIQEPLLAAWAAAYGLSPEECAMIQPAYGPPPSPETTYADIKKGYGISSGLVGGANLAISTAGFLLQGKSAGKISRIGLFTGTGQIILGIANIKKGSWEPLINGGEMYTSYRSQNNLSYINIAMGSATLFSSAINLLLQKKKGERKTAFGVYGYPDTNNSLAMGFSFSKRL